MRVKFLVFVLAALIAQAGVGVEPVTKIAEPRWAPHSYAKVIGYRFKLPSDDSKQPVPSGFTLLKDGVVDTTQLESLTAKAAELRPEQVRRLTMALQAKKVTYPAACYDPHHIFVFYSGDGKAVAAVEVCFGCTRVSALPELTEPMWYRHDFSALAHLSDELGLWFGTRTVKEWEALQGEVKRKPEKP